MRPLSMRKSRPSLRPEDIARAERELKVKFPDDYRDFLLRHNGGRPTPNVFPMSGDPLNPTGEVNWFYCIHAGDSYDIVREATVFRGRVPPEMMPIAEDANGNQICLVMKGRERGKVYFWDHEEESPEDDGPAYYGNLYPIANSFTEMIDSLEEPEEEE